MCVCVRESVCDGKIEIERSAFYFFLVVVVMSLSPVVFCVGIT